MIHNEREYKITKSLLKRLEVSLDNGESGDVPEWVVTAHKDALRSQIDELREDIEEYEHLKSNIDFIWECSDLRELPEFLIKARIASGFSQKQLADILNLKPQQIQRYESEFYKGANLNRLMDIASAVGVSVSGFIERSKESYSHGRLRTDETAIDWSKFPAKEMIIRGWVSSQSAIQGYLKEFAGEYFRSAFHRKKIHGKNKPDIYSLVAWQARVLQKAREESEARQLNEFRLDDSWVPEFAQLSNHANSPIAAKEFLADKGILLIVEKHLDRTYLDGAAMTSTSGFPVIGLTLRHDRLDNFWFVLMHELGHIFRHIFHGYNMDFFDEEDESDGDVIEREADEFALENLIPNELWGLCVSKYSATKEAVLADSSRLNINSAIIAGRIRKESGNYYSLTDLIGSGTVRKSLKEKF